MQIKDLAEKYELSKEPDVDFWKHQQSGQWILTHNAVEKIAIMEKIEISDIKILNSEEDLVRMLITMRIPFEIIDSETDKIIIVYKEVTSIGEADRKNCRSQYLGCMAEKRGIDRCVLKLISAYQYGIFSDVEADDFKKPAEEYYTEEQTAEFSKLIEHECFEGKKKAVKDELRKSTSKPHYQKVLNMMKQRIKEFENQKAEEINQDLDNQLEGKL